MRDWCYHLLIVQWFTFVRVSEWVNVCACVLVYISVLLFVYIQRDNTFHHCPYKLSMIVLNLSTSRNIYVLFIFMINNWGINKWCASCQIAFPNDFAWVNSEWAKSHVINKMWRINISICIWNFHRIERKPLHTLRCLILYHPVDCMPPNEWHVVCLEEWKQNKNISPQIKRPLFSMRFG